MIGRAYFPRSFFPGAGALAPAGPFVEAGITNIRALRYESDLLITWDSTWPNGTYYQVYIDHRLVHHDTARRAILPGIPNATHTVHVGKVAAADRDVSFAALLIDAVPGSGDRARLRWIGGRWLGAVVRFNVYAGRTAGGAIDWTNRIGSTLAAQGGSWGDGYGRGPYGRGPYGRGKVEYIYVTGKYPSGTWAFGIRAADRYGNESAGITVAQAIVAIPREIPIGPDGKRIRYTFNSSTGVATLAWDPSP